MTGKVSEWMADHGLVNGVPVVYLARFIGERRVSGNRLTPEAAHELARKLMSAADNAKNLTT